MTAQEKLIKLYQEAEQKLTAIILDKQSHGRAFMYELSLLQQVQQELNKLKKDSHAVVGELVRNNYQKGLTELVMEAQAAGMDPQSAGMLMMSGLNTSQIELLIENTDYDFNRAIHLVGRRMQDGIREAAIEAAAEKLTTGQTVRQMQKILEQKLTSQGLTSVEYAGGIQMPLSSYAEMVSRSTTAETQNAAKIVQGGAWGYELVTMTTHSPTCAICAMYQGRVYATTKEAANGKYRTKNGTILRFPYLYDTAFASGYDTIHPNCRHRIALFAWEAYTEEELRHYQNVSNAPFEDTRSDQERKAYSAAVAKRRQLLANRRQYLKIKEALPNDAPKSFAGFMRMKNANSERYRNLMRDYRQIKRISNVQDTMTEQVKTLSEEEQGILREYSGALASRLNAAIGRGKLTPELETKKDLLHQALSKGVMPETVTLYRDTCISFMNLGLTKSASEKELLSIIGRENTNEIFTSTSFSVLDLQSRDTRMYITVPKGYKGCQYIKPLVYNQYKGQEEVLFDAPLTYIINNATIDESGKILLYVEVLMKDGT